MCPICRHHPVFSKKLQESNDCRTRLMSCRCRKTATSARNGNHPPRAKTSPGVSAFGQRPVSRLGFRGSVHFPPTPMGAFPARPIGVRVTSRGCLCAPCDPVSGLVQRAVTLRIHPTTGRHKDRAMPVNRSGPRLPPLVLAGDRDFHHFGALAGADRTDALGRGLDDFVFDPQK